MTPEELLENIRSNPEATQFQDVIDTVSGHYEFTPTGFRNGNLYNKAGENEGSCRVFGFARLHDLDKQQTLNCFGDYYRRDVLGHPEGHDHGNIRNFMATGWAGVEFDTSPLTPRA